MIDLAVKIINILSITKFPLYFEMLSFNANSERIFCDL